MLYKTDVGLLTNNNLMYLIGQGVLFKDGEQFYINGRLIKSGIQKQPFKLWSLYRLVFEQVSGQIKSLKTNMILKYMRENIQQIDNYGLKIASEKGKTNKFSSDWSEL